MENADISNKTEQPTAERSSVRFSNAPYFWIFLASVAFGFIYSFQSAANPLFGAPIVDAAMYDEWANRIVKGQWLWTHIELYLPVYPYFLAILKLLFGQNIMVIRSAQILMGAASAVWLGKTAEQLWNRRAGVITAALIATNWMMAIYECEEYCEVFCIFFQSLTIWLLVCRPRTWLTLFLAGTAFAISVGARANLMMCLPVIALWAFLPNSKLTEPTGAILQRGAMTVIPLALGFALVIGPIAFRNHQLSGKWMLRGLSSWAFYVAFAPQFEGFLNPAPGVQFYNYMRQPIRDGIRDKGQLEPYWAEKTKEIVKNQPLSVAKGFLKRCVVFLNARDWSQEFDIDAYRAYSTWLSLPWPHAWLIVPAGLAGVICCTRGNRQRWMLLLFFLAGSLSVVLLKSSSRYRLVSLVLLTMFAGAALDVLFWQIRNRDWKQMGRIMALFLAGGLICWPDWARINDHYIARHWFYVGLWKNQLGRPDEAIAAFKLSMEQIPWDADSPYQIGAVLATRGQNAEARRYLEIALKREPEYPEAIASLASIELHEGNPAKADALTDQSLKLYPTDEFSLLLKARIRREQGRVNDELAFYERAIQENSSATVLIDFALRLEELDKLQDALTWLGRVVETPTYGSFERARAGMLVGYLFARKVHDFNRARQAWQSVADRFPSENFFVPQALFLAGKMDENEYRRRLPTKDSNVERDYYFYNVGLARKLAGQTMEARQAFIECIKPMEGSPGGKKYSLPQKWAQEALAQLDEQLQKQKEQPTSRLPF